MSVSQGFQRKRDGEGETLIATEAGPVFSPTWFDDVPTPVADAASTGRGGVRVFDTPLGRLIRRNYLRGGLPRFLTRDLYVWAGANATRAFAEFNLLTQLRADGLPVPAPVAARYQRHGLFYRAALLMRLIPDVRTLADVLEQADDVASVLDRVAVTVARMHRAKVWHADLNASNILIDASQQVWLIDFDRARSGVSDPGRLTGNLDRLHRSLRKLLPPTAFAGVEAAWPGFLASHRSSMIGVS